jgi:hypothetical protein
MRCEYLENKHTVVFFFFLIAMLCPIQAGLADYSLPAPAEDFMVVPDTWRLIREKKDGPITHIQCVCKGVQHSWPINRFWLADRLDSNTICTGHSKTMTESYLNAEEKLAQENKAAIEVVALKNGGPLMVVGLWNFGPAPKYESYYVKWSLPKQALDAAKEQERLKQVEMLGGR